MGIEFKLNKPLRKTIINRLIISFVSVFVFLVGISIYKLNNQVQVLSNGLETNSIQIDHVEFKQFEDIAKTEEYLHQLRTQQLLIQKDAKVESEEQQVLVANQDGIRRGLIKSLEYVFMNTSLVFPYVIEKTLPGVVGIERSDGGGGSGYVYNKALGHIVTARHVITHYDFDFSGLKVEMNGKFVPVLNLFIYSDDLAVLVVDVADPNYCAEVELKLADTGSIYRGQLVIQIGHPFGEIDSPTVGIVSNPDGSAYNYGPIYWDRENKVPRIQYDAASNPGNSGGPIIDLSGNVVGVAVSGRSNGVNQNTGVNHGVPVKTILECLERFEEWLKDTHS